MAVYNLAITYPDAAQSRVRAALKEQASASMRRNLDGTRPTATTAQALAWLDGYFKDALRDIVANYEKANAADAVVARAIS